MENILKRRKYNPKCPFCQGTGIAKCLDLSSVKLFSLPAGQYDLNELTRKYGEYAPCPENCIILN